MGFVSFINTLKSEAAEQHVMVKWSHGFLSLINLLFKTSPDDFPCSAGLRFIGGKPTS